MRCVMRGGGKFRALILSLLLIGDGLHGQAPVSPPPQEHTWPPQRPVSLLRGVTLGKPVATHTIKQGNLSVLFRDNSRSPEILGGIDSLFNVIDAPKFDAYDPDSPGGSAGMNFEHVISGHADPYTRFAPRTGPYTLHPLPDGASVMLVRQAKDSPWGLANAAKYTVVAPHYIDYEFRCVPHAPERFGERGYALLFWANYMNDVEDVALNFRGVARPGGPEEWIAGDAPEGSALWRGGGTYRPLAAKVDLGFDDPHTMNLNNWSYDWPRIAQPFYYGRAANGMVFILMFDKLWSAEEHIRFSLFKFKLRRGLKRPAWDFQYIMAKPEAGREYGFYARVVWKKFVSPEDCEKEYRTWVAAKRAVK